MFRGYDPALGRFLQVDPMAMKYDGLSPYQYAFNSPAVWNDPLGLDPEVRDFLLALFHSTSGSKHWAGSKIIDMYEDYADGRMSDWENMGFSVDYTEGVGGITLSWAEVITDENNSLLEVVYTEAWVSAESAQQGNGNPFTWEDADNVGDITSAMVAIPALAGGISEYEIVNKLVKNAQKDYYSEAIKSVGKYNKIVGAAGKVLGITGVVTSFGELVTEDFSWTNLTKFGINVAGLAIKANPIGLTVSLGIGLLDATGYLDKGLNYIYNENTSQ